MTQLTEDYRPRDLDSVVGQKKAVERIRILSQRGLGGRAYWISGLSGTGKTTIARIIGRLVADDWWSEVDASDVTPKFLSDWEKSLRSKPLGGKGWCLIVNEAHGLRKDAIRSLLVILERLPPYVAVVFTTTNEGQQSLFEDKIDAHPLLSRCVQLQLESSGSSLELDFAIHIRKVAQECNLDGQPIDRYVRLVRENRFNLRACLNAVESGELLV